MRASGLKGTADYGRRFDCAPDVIRISAGLANAYIVGDANRWILVDTGIPGLSRVLRRRVTRLLGPKARPEAIVLTHGHFDHSGGVDRLARWWNVPVYAHALELSYLAGRSQYPPQDPTVGGAMALLSRVFPEGGHRPLSTRVLPLGDVLPGMPAWRCIHTPGHTAGHIALFRESDRVLLAGDALSTMNLDAWGGQVRRAPELCGPPAPLTSDWDAAQASVRAIAALEPAAIAAGHGVPVAGPGLPAAFARFAAAFAPPRRGRYVRAAAATGPAGLEWLPPPVPDPLARTAAGAALMVIGGLGLAAALRR